MSYGSACPTYEDSREEVMVKLRVIVGETFQDFEALHNIEKASFALGCEFWIGNFYSLFV